MSAHTHLRSALQSIDEISRLRDVKQFEKVLRKSLENLGFHAFLLLGLPMQIRNAQPEYLIDSTPADWKETYLDGKFYENDHIARFGRRAIEPFNIRRAPYSASEAKTARRLLDALESFGLKSGIIVPTISIHGYVGSAALFGEDKKIASPLAHGAEILMRYVAHKVNALTSPPITADSYRLSKREREALHWTAQGKTAWEIGEIIRISESAANKLIGAAMKKLNTVSRTQAVATAIRLREIDP